MNLLALWERNIQNWTVVDFLKLIIVVCGCVGIAYIVMQVCGITIPPWLLKIGLIVLACVVGLIAINIVAGL